MSDLEPLDPHMFGEQACFGCGPRNASGLHLRFSRSADEVVTRFIPGANHEGPPGLLHGGLAITIADELAAWTLVGLRGRIGLTTAVDVRLARPTRIGVELEGRGAISKEVDRAIVVRVSLKQEGRTTLSGKLSFALPDLAAAERILGTLPESWQRFCR